MASDPIQIARVVSPAPPGSLDARRLQGVKPPRATIDDRWARAFPEQARFLDQFNGALEDWWKKVASIASTSSTAAGSSGSSSSSASAGGGSATASAGGDSLSPTAITSTPSAASSSDFTNSNPSDDQLILWVESEQIRILSVDSYNADGQMVSASVRWPDKTLGRYSTIRFNSAHKAVDSYQVSHTASGRRVFQPTVTRDADGNIIATPNMKVI